MNDMTLTREEREAKLEGMGCKRKRVEDIRFTQGKGNYVDDLKLPGMLHGDFVRSPHAHARVKSINTEAALKVPGVVPKLSATPGGFESGGVALGEHTDEILREIDYDAETIAALRSRGIVA